MISQRWVPELENQDAQWNFMRCSLRKGCGKKEVVLFYECGPGWDANPEAEALQSVYSGMESIIEVKSVGDVQSRTRKIATFLRNETVIVSDHFAR